MATRFIMSMNSWMSKNSLQSIDIEEFDSKYSPGKKTQLIRGDEEVIFLARKLHNKELDSDVLQIIEIDETNLCVCNKQTGKIVGKVVKK